MFWKKGIILLLLFVFYSTIDASYSTNFSSFDSNNWVLETHCNHCSHDNGIECTNYTTAAVTFGSVSNNTGVTITTVPLSKKTSCGGICASGHLGYQPQVKFGRFEVKSKWFPPGTGDVVKTGEGYIGIDGNGNDDSIYFGFDGNADTSFKTTCYTNGPGHGEQKISVPNDHVDADFNVYILEWLSDKVTWTFNGKIVRTVTDKSQIPQMALKIAIHSRSSNCAEMEKGTSLYTQHLYFKYTTESELMEGKYNDDK